MWWKSSWWKDFGAPLMAAVVGGTFLWTLQFLTTPSLERNKLIAQEQWKTKKDVYARAVQVVDKHFDAAGWTGPDVPPGCKPLGQEPTSSEKNEVFAQLLLVSEDFTVGQAFSDLLISKDKKANPVSRAQFIFLLRKDLYGKSPDIDPEHVPYVLNCQHETSPPTKP
jgi:hypothetical protein